LPSGYGIVQQHNGWIELESEVGQGACFDVYLPCTTEAPAPAPPVACAPVSTAGGGETILLVDDEEIVRDLARAILEQAGYRVIVAQDGLEALGLHARQRGDIRLVLLDLTMPGLSGRDTFQRLLELDPQVRVLFSSGYSAEDASVANEERAAGFIAKPYRVDDLLRAVRAALDRSAPGAAVETAACTAS
jgi:DNA-binding response OmpR family regulator